MLNQNSICKTIISKIVWITAKWKSKLSMFILYKRYNHQHLKKLNET